MLQKEFSQMANFYKTRFGYAFEQITTSPLPNVKLMIVIPCFNEPDLITTLQSLHHCDPTQHPVEVIVVINGRKQASEAIRVQNQVTKEKAGAWIKNHNRPALKFHLLEAEHLSPKHAGVGLARKIGMDEALYRFASIPYNGLIVCLDADCTVSPNYLCELEQAFLTQSFNACSIYFEHDLSEITDPMLKKGIIDYELFLRYYVHALRYSGFPFAVHTIGSSMAVRSDIYAKTGGMNRRKAGEDFYFIHKIIPQGHFINITTTSVFPSARISDRVPFGTGKAQQDWVNQPTREKLTYDLQTFNDLKQLIISTNQLYQAVEPGQYETLFRNFPESIQRFLDKEDFIIKLKEMQQHTKHFSSFHKRFFSWLDGFKALKFVHFARDHYHPQIPLLEAAAGLLVILQIPPPHSLSATALLFLYRKLDRESEEEVS